MQFYKMASFGLGSRARRSRVQRAGLSGRRFVASRKVTSRGLLDPSSRSTAISRQSV